MSKWITERKPTEADGYLVYRANGIVGHWALVPDGEAWKPVARIEPYVKPKRWCVKQYHDTGNWYVVERGSNGASCSAVPTREAAERIAAIYEEVMP